MLRMLKSADQTKTNWPFLKNFLTSETVTLIPPTFNQNKYIADNNEKLNLLLFSFLNNVGD